MVFERAFRARKVVETFEKRAPGHSFIPDTDYKEKITYKSRHIYLRQ